MPRFEITSEGAEINLSSTRRKWRCNHEKCEVEPLYFLLPLVVTKHVAFGRIDQNKKNRLVEKMLKAISRASFQRSSITQFPILSAEPSIQTAPPPPPNGPLRSWGDQPSAESRLRDDALTFLTSSALSSTKQEVEPSQRTLPYPPLPDQLGLESALCWYRSWSGACSLGERS